MKGKYGDLKMLFSLAAIIVSASISAQLYDKDSKPVANDFKWPEGKKMAISLTFDDARLSQIDKGIPLLDKHGVKGTFYVSPNAVTQRLDG